jgi:hypothetical protein
MGRRNAIEIEPSRNASASSTVGARAARPPLESHRRRDPSTARDNAKPGRISHRRAKSLARDVLTGACGPSGMLAERRCCVAIEAAKHYLNDKRHVLRCRRAKTTPRTGEKESGRNESGRKRKRAKRPRHHHARAPDRERPITPHHASPRLKCDPLDHPGREFRALGRGSCP